MIVPNNTHYMAIGTRTHNSVPDTNSFAFESSKRSGYMQRLYYEFQYTLNVKGQAFFYTFTYNNKSIPHFSIPNIEYNDKVSGSPKFFEFNVFDYNDIRLITNGKLVKHLARHYGTRLRYFCACESGEGKGVRGLGNNPHYHFIFFLQPLHDKDGKPIFDGYKKISSIEFKYLCQELWQGRPGYIPFKSARFGIVKEGDNIGQVYNADCFGYVVKYVLKDNIEKSTELKVLRYYEWLSNHEWLSYDCFLCYYKYLCTYYFHTKQEFIDTFNLIGFNHCRKATPSLTIKDWIEKGYAGDKAKISLCHMKDWFDDFFKPMYVKLKMQYFKNRYSGKVRCSKNLGDFGLMFLDSTHTKFTIPTSSGLQVQNPSLFYIRKLYYNHSICPVTGNVLYYLNEDGIKMKLNNLESSIKSKIAKTKEFVSMFMMGEYSPICEDFNLQSFKDKLSSFLSSSSIDDILFRYSVYTIVYSYRYFIDYTDTNLDYQLSLDLVKKDYEKFLRLSFYYLDYEENNIERYYESYYHKFGLTSYLEHIAFKDYKDVFKMLDLVESVMSPIISAGKKIEFEARSNIRRIHNQFQYSCFVS